MINFEALRQYTQVVNGIRFLSTLKEKYELTYFSENSNLLDDYAKLNIRLMDVRINVVPITKVPRTRLTPNIIKAFKNLGLTTYSSVMKIPKLKNFFFDLSQYLNSIELIYHPSNYRQRLSNFVKNSIDQSFAQYSDYERVLIYSIDITKPFNRFTDRKGFPILQQLKDENFLFDDLILCVITPSGPRYRLLVKRKQYKLEKIIPYLKMIKQLESLENEENVENEEEIDQATNHVMNHLDDKVLEKNRIVVKDAVKSYLKQDENTVGRIMTKSVKPEVLPKIGIASILYKVSGDITKAKKITNSIPTKKVVSVLKTIDKRYSDQILQSIPPVNTTENVVVKSFNVPSVVSNKSPNHLFQKRQIDFSTNLHKDLTNSFNVLETKELPLKVGKIEIVNKPEKRGEIEKSDISLIKTSLKDEFGNLHNIQIEIPKIDPNSGTFRVNGQRKCLVNQIVLCPITFPKKFESRFESSYSIFRIRSKKTRNLEYLEIFIANSWLPLSILTFYSFGFKETLTQYGINYKISNDKPDRNEKFSCKISDSDYIYFSKVDNQLKQEFCKSFINSKIDSYKITKEFGTKEYFNDLIIKITGRVNSTFLISSNLENIVDPVVKQVLINQQLPSDLKQIIFYMSSKVVQGFIQDRNDLVNQRIRGSEILVHLIQKQILASYTTYKQQILSGNKNAKFEINPTKTLSDFIRSEVVANMEYANPVEEMSVMTRVSPLGKNIGGIPDKEAIRNEARNVHESYYGNIDPLDTPEGGMIGISQQLAIDSFITSARGIFQKKEFNDKEKSGILSTSTCLIPFVENNDGARIIMASSQVKQMLPLKNPEPPAVRSGYESILPSNLSDNFIKKSPCDGKVIKLDSDSITVLCKDKKKREISLIPIHLKSGSGKNTLSIFKTKIVLNQFVKEGQVISEGSCISNGTISLGKTLCTAVMPYKGYNFEDGIIINEKLIDGDKLTSIHGIMEEVLVSENDKVVEIAKIGIYIEKGKPILRKTIGEIEQLLGTNEEDDTEELQGRFFIKKSPGGIVVDIDVYSNTDNSKFPILKDLIDRTKKKNGIISNEKFTVKGNTIKGILIRFKIEQELKITLGDKLCNRYGGKGIISLVEKDEMMPRTPWGTVDIIINPIGILNRSNIGQLFELYVGLISKDLGVRISGLKNREQILNLIKKVYSILDNSKNKQNSIKLISNLNKLSNVEFLNLVNQIRSSGFTPIIIPPFQAPKQDQILQALSLLGLKPGYQLFLPSYGVKTERDVPVGYMYFSKLEHMADEKVYGRSTGPVTGKTMQPTAGRKQEGGQRLGEADTYSLISYNCPVLLSELMGSLSDDFTTKNEIITDIIHTGTAEYRNAKISPARDLLDSYFISLMLRR